MVDELYLHDEDDQTQEESEIEETKENEIEETKDSDGNNIEEQKKLGIEIHMIGARKEELERTRSQTKEMMSPRNESMERAELTMEDWIHETCLISAVTSGPTEPKTFREAWHVGSHQVPFLMCTLETLQKYCSTSSLLLTFC